jgi:hypothetical protein
MQGIGFSAGGTSRALAAPIEAKRHRKQVFLRVWLVLLPRAAATGLAQVSRRARRIVGLRGDRFVPENQRTACATASHWRMFGCRNLLLSPALMTRCLAGLTACDQMLPDAALWRLDAAFAEDGKAYDQHGMDGALSSFKGQAEGRPSCRQLVGNTGIL